MAGLLDYQHVEISFNGNAVVHDVTFQLHPGEILGLVGESGSGKSTLIKAAMGLLGSSGMVTRGDIWFEEKTCRICLTRRCGISAEKRSA